MENQNLIFKTIWAVEIFSHFSPCYRHCNNCQCIECKLRETENNYFMQRSMAFNCKPIELVALKQLKILNYSDIIIYNYFACNSCVLIFQIFLKCCRSSMSLVANVLSVVAVSTNWNRNSLHLLPLQSSFNFKLCAFFAELLHKMFLIKFHSHFRDEWRHFCA